MKYVVFLNTLCILTVFNSHIFSVIYLAKKKFRGVRKIILEESVICLASITKDLH